VGWLRHECHIEEALDRSAAMAAIAGFTVDDIAMTLFVGPEIACSAAGFSVKIAWDDVKALVDPVGPVTRMKPHVTSSQAPR
jgi:hypothetical protein